jgi:predicted phage-related endonuclease
MQMTIAEPQVTLPGCIVEPYATLDEWLHARGKVIGASESPGILNVGYADESALMTWGRKTGRIPEMDDSNLLECGRVMQPGIIELFKRRSGFKVQTLGEFTICRSEEYPWLGCTLDGLIEMDDGIAVVEAKNVSVFMAHDWDDDQPPLKYQVQVQHQIAATGAVRAFVLGLIGGNNLKWVAADRNQPFIDALIPRLEAFHKLVETDTPPPAELTEAGLKALKKLHPLDNGVTEELPPESLEWHKELELAKGMIKHWESEETRLKVLLTQEIGANSCGLLPDGSRYTYRHQSRSNYTCENCGFSKRSKPFRVLRHSK